MTRLTTASPELRDPARIQEILAATRGTPALPSFASHPIWERLRDRPLARTIIAYAEAHLGQPVPMLSATLYLDFLRTGTRRPFEALSNARRKPLAYATLAECLEGEGRFDDTILDRVWAICEETSWVYPAHAHAYPDGLGDAGVHLIDLFSALDGLMLAEIDHLLGERLHPAARRRIRAEVRRRNTAAFLARDDHRWMLAPGAEIAPNWTSVCIAGVVGGALYLEDDPDVLARVVAKSMPPLERYLATFDPAGGSAEGVTYWNFGFGLFTILADLLHHRTLGRIDLLADPRADQIARFPFRTQLGPQAWVTLSDCPFDGEIEPALFTKLGARLDLPELGRLYPPGTGDRQVPVPSHAMELRCLLWAPDEPPASPARPAAQDWFAGIQWLIARAEPSDPNSLVLAVKAGHNGEPHNHNDIGSFIVHWRGEQLLVDLGMPVYRRETFLRETRYGFFTNRSAGHSVPLVNGHEQSVGSEFRARDVAPVEDAVRSGLRMDLAGAYSAVAGLARLDRSVVLVRDTAGGRVEIVDEAVFASPSASFETALITLGQAEADGPGALRINGTNGALRVTYDPAAVEALIEPPQTVDLRRGPTQVVKVRLRSLAASDRQRIAVDLAPMPLLPEDHP